MAVPDFQTTMRPQVETVFPYLIRPGSLDPEILVRTAALRSDFTHWGGTWADVFDRAPA